MIKKIEQIIKNLKTHSKESTKQKKDNLALKIKMFEDLKRMMFDLEINNGNQTNKLKTILGELNNSTYQTLTLTDDENVCLRNLQLMVEKKLTQTTRKWWLVGCLIVIPILFLSFISWPYYNKKPIKLPPITSQEQKGGHQQMMKPQEIQQPTNSETTTLPTAPHRQNQAPKPQQPETPKPQQPETPKPQQPETPKPQQPETPKPQQPETPKPQQPETPKPQKPVTPIATTELENPQPGSNLKYPPKYTYTDKTETIGYKADGKTLSYIVEYDQETGKMTKYTWYRSDGKTVISITEYDPDTGERIKETKYNPDGKTVISITEYDPDTGNKIKETWYQSDGIGLFCIKEYDKDTGINFKITFYNPDGKTVISIAEYDPDTGERIKETIYNDDGTKLN